MCAGAKGVKDAIRILSLFKQKGFLHQSVQMGKVSAFGGVTHAILGAPAVEQMIVADVIQMQAVDGITAAKLSDNMLHTVDISLVCEGDERLVSAADQVKTAAFGMECLVVFVTGGGEPCMHTDAGSMSGVKQLGEQIPTTAGRREAAPEGNRSGKSFAQEENISNADAKAA